MGHNRETSKKGKLDAPFQWNKRRLQIAFQLAQGQETKTSIARKFGIHRKTIHHWETFKEFQEKVLENREKIIQDTDEKLIRGLSEQVFKVRHILNEKLSRASAIEATDTVKLIGEFRKLMETLHKIGNTKTSVPQEHLVNVNYGGRVQIENILNDIEDVVQKGKVKTRLDDIAGQIIEDKAREMGGFGGIEELP